jgi:tRNA 2-thiouridine synthesizing protein E
MSEAIPDFPHAPLGWTPDDAIRMARDEGLDLSGDHWEVVKALQEYFDKHSDQPAFAPRELHDALEDGFHAKGGLRYLYQIFPGGPVAQGCRIAGLKAPSIATDLSFGSVM